jgi:hypothetical protein
MTRYAVINTRHRTDSGRLAVAIDGGDQDADTTPEPPPVAPAALLIAVLRSVGGEFVGGGGQSVDGGFGEHGVGHDGQPFVGPAI